MAVDTSDPALKKAIDDIRDPNNEDTWVIMSHVGTTPKIRVVETGSGFDDFMDELDHSKILYCYMRFDINDMNKFLFVSWCGDGIHDQMFKGKFGSFQRDMEFFMKGYYHVHINARNEDDLDEDDIQARLKVATGALYALQSNKRNLTTDEAKKNIMASKPEIVARDKSVTINQEATAKFWAQQQKEQEEEEQKQQQQQQRQRSNPSEVSKERNEFWKKQQEAKQLEQQKEDDELKERQARQSELSNIQSQSKSFWKQQQQQQQDQEEQEQSKSKDRPAPASNASTSNLRARFEQLAMEKQQENEKADRPAPRPVSKFPPVQSNVDSSPTDVPPATRPTPPVFAKHEPEPEPEEEPQLEEEYYEEPQQQEEEEYYEEPQQQQEEEYYEEPQQQQEEEYYEEPQQQQEEEYYEEPQQQQEEEYQDDTQQSLEKIAVALFDFQSDDPEELPFSEGESLYVLSEDGDWWLAQNGDGRQGFVPANYLQSQ